MTSVTDEDLLDVWAARLELRLKRGTKEYSQGYRGAYTTVLVRCGSALQFVAAAEEHLDSEGFIISGIEILFPLIADKFEITDALAELIPKTHEFPLQWTTFHMFKDDA